MKILIFGASGVGKTTLGAAIARQTGFEHLDSDRYYWKKTRPTFEGKRSLFVRNLKITRDFKRHDQVVLSGCMMTWGKKWQTAFDLVVFLQLDDELRMKRLRRRELDRYGQPSDWNAETKERSRLFLEWAAQYRNPEFRGNSRSYHEQWLARYKGPVLRLDSHDSLATNSEKTIVEMKRLEKEV